jgi:hypothetical protein
VSTQALIPRIPRGYELDHSKPDAFVVRCRSCGVIAREATRPAAHSCADTHGLNCAPAGVTPISRIDYEERSTHAEDLATLTYRSVRSGNHVDVRGPVVDVRQVAQDETPGREIAIADQHRDRLVIVRFDCESEEHSTAWSLTEHQRTTLGPVQAFEVQSIGGDSVAEGQR